MKFSRFLITLTFSCSIILSFAQRGKNGPRVVAAANTIVNEYTTLTANASAGASTISVTASGLNTNGRFTGNLQAGDLILIIQMQGVTINGTLVGVAGVPNDATWGSVVNYNNCGNYEFLEVASVPNGTSITFTCGLQNNYTSAGRVQVIRIPRYTTLTVNNPGVLTGQTWNGTTGGIVSVEVRDTTRINAGAFISANAIGFRGGVNADNNDYFGGGFYSSIDNGEGSEKGEGIAGYQADYDIYGGRYGRASAANAGGGGTAHNSGGGGGGNGGVIASWTGNGNPDISLAGYVTAWNLELAGFAASTSSGGGRGGYSFSSSNQNATTTAPGNGAWSGDNRRVMGGLGGHPLDYSTGKIFLGGGGGAGDQNDGDGGNGGRGGGLVLILSYGIINGTGSITANGENGQNANNAGPPISGYAGIDAAGGAGSGGTVILKSSGAISTITINANGGNGGNQFFSNGVLASSTYNPAYGPGGGGGGGYIAISNGAITRTATGGINGTTSSSGLTEFPPNGATTGGAGTNNAATDYFELVVPNDTITICSSGTATFTASINGTAPGGTTISWYTTQFGSTVLQTGTSFTTPALATTTTYYVGTCPGSYRIPVTVIVGGPVINSAGMVINNATCAGNDGSITGIIVTGATSYDWNGSASVGPDLTGAASGSYTLTVSNGPCTATAGPFIIGSTGGPVIDDSNISITDATCAGGDGSITGIIVTGATSYDWNGTASGNADLSNANAGSYTLTVTDGLGCTATSGPYTIGNGGGPTVNTAGLTITSTTCGLTNGSITGIIASGTATLTYDWNGTASVGPDQTGLASGSYTLTVTDGNGCTITSGPHIVNASSSPVIDISTLNTTDATCGSNNGAITGITVSGGQTPYTYTWNGINATGVDTSNLGGGSYTLIVTDALGCSDTETGIIINTLGGATIDASNVVITATTCGLNNGTITGIQISGGTNPIGIEYNSIVVPSADASGLSAGSYLLEVTDGSGCISSAGPFIVDTSSSPIASATVVDVSCNGLSDGSATATVSQGSGSYTFNWISGPANATYTNLSAGTYTVVVTDNLGCDDTTSVTVTEPAALAISISGTNLICSGQSTTLTASGATSYVWSTTETTTSINPSPSSTLTYSVTGTVGTCSDTASIVVTVNSLPVAMLSGDTTICQGLSTTLTGAGGTSYEWSTGETTSSINYTTASNSVVYVIATNNCGNDTALVNILVNTPPVANAGSDITIALGNGTTLTGTGGVSFVWTPSSGLNCTTCQSPFASPTSTTTYTLTVTDANGCTASDDVTITVDAIFGLFIPDAFSPNNDGSNDVLFVRGNGFSEFEFRLYDRWGQLVFTTTELTVGWDGTFKNKPLNEGVFVYTFEGTYLDGTSFSEKGNITLHK